MYKLIKQGNPILLEVAVEVEHGDAIRELTNAMKAILEYNRALGIAAPQVGVSKRIIMLRTDDSTYTMINPVIVRRWGKTIFTTESCLSFPGMKRKIPRDEWVQVEYVDENYMGKMRRFSKMNAIVVAHEIDHLDGITLLNR